MASSSVKKHSLGCPAVHLKRGDYNGKAAVCRPLLKQQTGRVSGSREMVLAVSIGISSFIKTLVKRKTTDPSPHRTSCRYFFGHVCVFLTRY